MPIFEAGAHFFGRRGAELILGKAERGQPGANDPQSLTTLMSGAAGFFMPTTW